MHKYFSQDVLKLNSRKTADFINISVIYARKLMKLDLTSYFVGKYLQVKKMNDELLF